MNRLNTFQSFDIQSAKIGMLGRWPPDVTRGGGAEMAFPKSFRDSLSTAAKKRMEKCQKIKCVFAA